MRPLSILLLCDTDPAHADNLLDHIGAFKRYSSYDVRIYNPRGVPQSRFLDLDAFDVCVIHYSLVITSDNYLAPWLRERIAAFEGLKVQFLQDEYRWVDEITAAMRLLGVHVLFSIVPARSIPAVYEGRLEDVEIVPTLAGFVPEKLARIGRAPTPRMRSIDVGYRGRVLPYWIGALSQEKATIAREFVRRAPQYGLRVDVAWSEADRIYGEAWIRFLQSCRTTLGTESGSSITDFDGSVEKATLGYLAAHPDASFEQVSGAVLAPYEGNIMMNVISPRIFEAAALRTGLVLFPGEYGGILEPERHYVALEKDFSNLDAVVAAIRDDRRLESMTERTHADLVASGRYSLQAFVREFDAVVDRRAIRAATRPRRTYTAARIERPFVTRTVFGVDLVQTRENWRRRRVAIELIRANPSLRALAGAYARDAELRERFGARRALEDALRLGLLLREHSGGSLVTEPFFVRASVTEPATLTLKASARATNDVVASTDSTAAATIPSGPDLTILWDHTGISPLVMISRPGRQHVGLQVGYYRTLAVYHFGVVEALAANHADQVRAALLPLLGPPHPSRNDDPGLAPKSISAARCLTFARRRGGAWRDRLKATRLVLGAAARRPGLAARFVSLRSDTSWKALVVELVKVDALYEASAGKVHGVRRIGLVTTEDTLTFATNRESDGTLGAPPPVRVVWDHSALGSTLSHRGVPLSLGPAGILELPGLSRLLRRAGTHNWQALLPDADAPERGAQKNMAGRTL